ncbi:hypothetical protein NQZ68_001076 [Dissostichus eleginoides]|nr:hypothetical protein NQZ68_001076 [Dissostichus eleginoides]
MRSFVRLLTRLLINPMSAVQGRLSSPPCISPPSPSSLFQSASKPVGALNYKPHTVCLSLCALTNCGKDI